MEPLKLMCVVYCNIINGKPNKDSIPVPQVGDKVTGLSVDEIAGQSYYTLAEYDSKYVFNTKAFAILAEQSAYEMAIEAHEAIIYAR